jgi:four helix bundle protein
VWDFCWSTLSRSQTREINADFISKIEGALQELDETCYWLQLIEKSDMISAQRLSPLQAEAVELMKILVTIAKRAKEKLKK